MSIAVGQVWRGRNHGSLLKVLAVGETDVTYLWVYAGNPYFADRVGTVGRAVHGAWGELVEYAPEWNDSPQNTGSPRIG